MSDKDLKKARKSRRSRDQIAKDRFDYLEAYALSVNTTRLQHAIKIGKDEMSACAANIENFNGAFDIIRQCLFGGTEPAPKSHAS